MKKWILYTTLVCFIISISSCAPGYGSCIGLQKNYQKPMYKRNISMKGECYPF